MFVNPGLIVFLTINFADSHSETELSIWIISGVVCSVVFLSVGVLLGALLHHLKNKELIRENNP